jgi:hypothetical protein
MAALLVFTFVLSDPGHDRGTQIANQMKTKFKSMFFIKNTHAKTEWK